MVKKFNIFSCAASVACLCLFCQDAGADGRQPEATALAPDAGAGATIRLAATTKPRRKAKSKAKKEKKKGTKKKSKCPPYCGQTVDIGPL